MSTGGISSRSTVPTPQWSWANFDPSPENGPAPMPPTSTSTSTSNTTPFTHAQTPEDLASGQAPPRRVRKHYGPRTCRICLEVVQPSFDVDEGALFGMRSRVKYVSEDADLGRLISPCLCKGSQRYVHDGCLQAWRQAAPLADRNYWRCPTCQYQYRMERLRWAGWITNRGFRMLLTGLVLLITIFLLGFVADPIFNLWEDPVGTIAGTVVDVFDNVEAAKDYVIDDDGSWGAHFFKGLASLGVLGFLKTFLASPLSWWHYRPGRVGGNRRGGTGRDRAADVSLLVIALGVVTFLGVVWKAISALSARFLEKVSDKVLDVQGDDDDEDEAEVTAETRKDE